MSVSEIFIEAAIKDSFSIGRLENASLHTHSANRLMYHRILFIEKGSGQLIVDGSGFSIRGQEIILMAKGQLYQFEQAGILTGFTLSFGDCFWEKSPASASNCKAVLFSNAAANQQLPLTTAEFIDLQAVIQSLRNEFEQDDYINKIDALAAYLKIIMIKIANVKMTEESTVDTQDLLLYRKFVDSLISQIKTCREVSDYATMLGITSRRLSDLCKRCSHKTAKELITEQLIAEAKRLLQFTSQPVKEIAYELSFNSPEQFSHFFKKSTSYSPAIYREQFLSIGTAPLSTFSVGKIV